MAVFQDYLRDGLDGPLLIKNGDFVVGPSDNQHIHDLLVDVPGWWHQYPAIGCSLINYQRGSINITQLTNIIRTQLSQDGYTVGFPKIAFDASGNILDITPNAIRN